MTLVIAMLLVIGFGFSKWWLIPIFFVWLLHLAANGK
jgi:hypothetical protein